MPLSAELSPDDAAKSSAPTQTGAYGLCTATILGVVLLSAMALLTLLRWTGDASPTLEKVVQQPVPADAAADSARPDLTAPDPGDNPP